MKREALKYEAAIRTLELFAGFPSFLRPSFGTEV
jgi:hypothetical protein